MIGNDIVDLQFVESPAHRHVQFLERVCTDAESRIIRESPAPHESLAAIWASKEALYKLLTQEGIECKFVPREFSTNFGTRERMLSGSALCVEFRGRRRRVRLSITEKWVHAVATAAGFAGIVRWMVAEIQPANSRSGEVSNESAAVRSLAARLVVKSGVDGAALDFAGRVPVVISKSACACGLALSLSHHGSYAAAALARVPHVHPMPRVPLPAPPPVKIADGLAANSQKRSFR